MGMILGVELATGGYHFGVSMRVSSLPYRLVRRKSSAAQFPEIVLFCMEKIWDEKMWFLLGILRFLGCNVVVNRGEVVVKCVAKLVC
jgi:hypothetical protein